MTTAKVVSGEMLRYPYLTTSTAYNTPQHDAVPLWRPNQCCLPSLELILPFFYHVDIVSGLVYVGQQVID